MLRPGWSSPPFRMLSLPINKHSPEFHFPGFFPKEMVLGLYPSSRFEQLQQMRIVMAAVSPLAPSLIRPKIESKSSSDGRDKLPEWMVRDGFPEKSILNGIYIYLFIYYIYIHSFIIMLYKFYILYNIYILYIYTIRWNGFRWDIQCS
jgi:hypothetical protein